MDEAEILQQDADESWYEDAFEDEPYEGDDEDEEDPYRDVDILVREFERWNDERSYERAIEAIRALPDEDPMQLLRKASVLHAFAERRPDAALLFEARILYEDVARSPMLARPFRDLATQFAAEAAEEERDARRTMPR